jgi:hypothetical protein
MAFPSMAQQQHEAIGHAAAAAKAGAGVTGIRASMDSGFLAAGDVCCVTCDVCRVPCGE